MRDREVFNDKNGDDGTDDEENIFMYFGEDQHGEVEPEICNWDS